MKKRLVTLNRLRSKILLVRRLSWERLGMGGDASDIVHSLKQLNRLLGQKQLRAGERELDALIVRLGEPGAFRDVDRPAA